MSPFIADESASLQTARRDNTAPALSPELQRRLDEVKARLRFWVESFPAGHTATGVR
jgi:hypothetical protein